MQKRRVKVAGDLPVTMTDAAAASRLAERKARRQNRTNNNQNKKMQSSCPAFVLFFVFIIMLGVILFKTSTFDYVSHHPGGEKDTDLNAVNSHGRGDKALSSFTSLDHALANANLVGLYFAASWCPMSTPITNKMSDIFSSGTSSLQERILSPLKPHIAHENIVRKDLAIVYVSSDKSETDMKKYSKSNWINVPFDSDDRDNLKRHFRTCAQVEMEELGIERRRLEIPSLIIIDSVTHGVLSLNGKEDMLEYGDGVLDHWQQLQDLLRSLEEKYVDED